MRNSIRLPVSFFLIAACAVISIAQTNRGGINCIISNNNGGVITCGDETFTADLLNTEIEIDHLTGNRIYCPTLRQYKRQQLAADFQAPQLQ